MCADMIVHVLNELNKEGKHHNSVRSVDVQPRKRDNPPQMQQSSTNAQMHESELHVAQQNESMKMSRCHSCLWKVKGSGLKLIANKNKRSRMY